MNENVDIFVYSHIPFVPQVTNKVYKILTNSHEEFKNTRGLELYRDYTGDNISDENLMYNEYSGFYWLWKNYPLKKYVGLNHYRRYYYFLDAVPDIEKIFKYFKIILNEPKELKVEGQTYDNRTWYDYWHNVQDFDILEQLFHEKFPEYTVGFERMKNAKYLYNSSMFIMSREEFNEYCDFIFDVLMEYRKMCGYDTVEDCIKHVSDNQELYIKPHLPYYTVNIQARIVGYIAERALNAYLMNGEKSLESQSIKFKWGMVRHYKQ